LGDQIEHIIPDLGKWPITHFFENRSTFIEALNDYTYNKLLEKDSDLKSILEKTIYMEKERVKNKPLKVDPPDDKDYWARLGQKLAGATMPDHQQELVEKIIKRIINRYSEEIVSGFVPKTFKFARKFLTGVFKRLFNKIRFPYLFKAWGPKEELLDKIKVSGKLDELRSLFPKGTIVLVPNHFSNLDSILLGYAIDYKAGVPAFTWGAGLNLFDYEILARYMNRLGTYRVDRRKKNPIYLETLKSMSALSLHFGLNNIFFPGGTRSRNGEMEKNIKLGLLQSTMEAQRLNYEKGKDKKIIIVPVVLGYHFVLEAKSLIEQYLRQAGREKYTRIKTRNSVIRKSWVVFKNILRKETDVRIHFCQPMDVLGNELDMDGNSINSTGKIVDLKEYFRKGDEVNKDNQREKVYTQVLANRIINAYREENVVLSTHLLAFVAFELAERKFVGLSVFEMVNRLNRSFSIESAELHHELSTVIAQLKLKEEAGEIMLSETVRSGATECMASGLKKLGLFHQRRPLYRKNSKLIGSDSLKLLYFYHNRLVGFGIEAFMNKYDHQDLIK